MRARSMILAALGTTLVLGSTLQAFAYPDDWHHREWREHHEWRHGYYAPPAVVAPPAYGYYAPPPVYAGPSLNFGVTIR